TVGRPPSARDDAAAARTSNYSRIRILDGKRTSTGRLTARQRRLTVRQRRLTTRDTDRRRCADLRLLVSHRRRGLVRHHPVVAAGGHRLARRFGRLLRLLLLAAMAGHSTLPA